MAGDDDLRAEVERLREENARLKARPHTRLFLKVSEKGGVSLYGLQKFPITHYKDQWTRILDMAEEIRAFIKENNEVLKSKGDRGSGE